MGQVLTVICKLLPTPEQVAAFDTTCQAFGDACNYANRTVKPNLTSKATIQSQVYYHLREEFSLTANLAVRACTRLSQARKTAKASGQKVGHFQATSVDYDAKTFSFRESDWTVSLSTVKGRARVPAQVGDYQRDRLAGEKPTSAQLCKHRDGDYYAHIQIELDVPEPNDPQKTIGVDLRRRDIAVTSEGQKWNGQSIQSKRDRFSRVRASIQKQASQGTRSTRRRARELLKRLSGKE